jgi:hypothetical protein
VTKRLLMMLSLLFAVGLIAAGCGGDDDETTSTTTTETTEETVPTGPTGADAGDAEAAVESCIAQLDAFPAEISDDVRAEVEELCQNTEEVSVEEGQQIAEDVCTLLVEDVLPEGAQRETALEACAQAGEGALPST